MATHASLPVAFDGCLMSPRTLTRSELRAWLQLAGTAGLPTAVLRVLLDTFGLRGSGAARGGDRVVRRCQERGR